MKATLKKVALFLELVKFPHTAFALPFASTGAILAARGVPSGRTLFWVLIAMVGARTGAMAFNRLADRKLDAINPRTKDRALPRGLITMGEVAFLTFFSFGLLFYGAFKLNPLCFKLAPLAVAIVSLYSYTKRFTPFTHFFLGLALSLAPIGAWLAVTGSFALPPLVLGLAVLTWVAGFDILYALADVHFDRSHGLYSIPARFGPEVGILLSRILHLFTLLLLALLIPLYGLGPFYLLGLALAGALLFYEHFLLERYGMAKLEVAFFNVNGIFSFSLFTFTLLDLLL